MNYPTDQLKRILFLDIETATQHATYEEVDDTLKIHWQKKMQRHVPVEDYPSFEEEFAALYQDKGAIYAEFAKVVCVSVGYLTESEDGITCKVKSFASEDEVEVLSAFHELLNEHYYDRFNQFLCGHNIKEFDVPFLCRRSMINNLDLPNLMRIAGYKPWQVHHLLDTMEMWKYGDYKHYTSLDLLCHILGVETPKNDMNGSQVSRAFWDGRLNEIVTYCQKDVVATAKVYLRCIGRTPFMDEDVMIVEKTEGTSVDDNHV